MWEAKFYEDADGNEPCKNWMEDDLRDVELDALTAAIEHVLEPRGLDVCETEWGKPLGDGLYEFRVRHSAGEIRHMFAGTTAEGADVGEDVLLRLFFTTDAGYVILLLGGYDKGEDPSEKRQKREIDTARTRLKKFKERRATEKRAAKKVGGKKASSPQRDGRGRRG